MRRVGKKVGGGPPGDCTPPSSLGQVGKRTLIESLLTQYRDESAELVKKMESACKPGSVENSHSSGIAVTGDLKRPTRKHGGTPAATCVATFLFGLAPGGVCRAVLCCHRRGALLP